MSSYTDNAFYNLDVMDLSVVEDKLTRHIRHVLPRETKSDIQLFKQSGKITKTIVLVLWTKKHKSMFNFNFIKTEPSGRIRILQPFINYMLKFIASIKYSRVGWIDQTVDMVYICRKSRDDLLSANVELNDIGYLHSEYMKQHLTYETKLSDSLESEYIDEHLPRINELIDAFTIISKTFSTANTIRNYYNKCDIIHRLNLRTHDFKPWKLYASDPIYPDCMYPMCYDDSECITTFDADFIIPEDIGRIITEFVGYDFIYNVKVGLIMKAKQRTVMYSDIVSNLYQWTREYLLDFIHASPYNDQNIKNVTSRGDIYSYQLKIFKTANKEKLITMLMTNIIKKEIHYPFYRDVMILTPIIKDRRRTAREKKD